MTVSTLSQFLQVVRRTSLLVATQLSLGDGGGQPVVALNTPGQDEEVGALGVGDAVLWCGEAEGEFGAVDRANVGYSCAVSANRTAP